MKITHWSLPKIWYQVPADYFHRGVKTNIFQRWWHLGKYRAVSEVLKLSPAKTILDVGSADGSFVNRLAPVLGDKGRIFAVDPYLPPLIVGRKLFPDTNFIQADCRFLPFKDRSMDAVVICETLEHVVDPFCSLLEMKRLLKETGYLIVEIDSGSLLFRLVWFLWKKLGPGRVWNHAHLTYFNVNLLEQLFINAGFKIDKKIMFNAGMGVCFRLVYSSG